MAEETKSNKSEYTLKVEALTMELMKLAQAQKENAETGLIIISVNTEKGADHDEIIQCMVGRKRALTTGLLSFADSKDKDMRRIFLDVAGRVASRQLLKDLFSIVSGNDKDGEE